MVKSNFVFLNIVDPWLTVTAGAEPAVIESQLYFFAQWLEVLPSLFHHSQDKILHHSSGWPGTCSHLPASASKVPEL